MSVEGFEGKFVAINMTTDEVVASADDPRTLAHIIRDLHLENVMTVGVPPIDEPLRVGLG